MTSRKESSNIAVKLIALALMVALLFGFREVRSHPRFAEEDQHRVWIAVLKGLNGPVRYLGSDATFSYFRIGSVLPKCYKVRTAEINLPPEASFSLSEGKARDITEQAWVAGRPQSR